MEKYHAPAKQILLGVWIVFSPRHLNPYSPSKNYLFQKAKQQ
jgi:hypothetical protein